MVFFAFGRYRPYFSRAVNMLRRGIAKLLELLSTSGVSIGSKKPLLMYTINPNDLSGNKFKSLIGALKIQRQHGVGWFECNVNFLLNIAGRLIEFLLPSRRR